MRLCKILILAQEILARCVCYVTMLIIFAEFFTKLLQKQEKYEKKTWENKGNKHMKTWGGNIEK
jgi:hypothetical protein